MKKLLLLLLFIITISSAYASPIETFNIKTYIPEVDITITYCNQEHTFTCDEDFCFIDPINCGQTTLVVEDISHTTNPILSLEIYLEDMPYATNEMEPEETWQILDQTIIFLNYEHEIIENLEIQSGENEITYFTLNNKDHLLHVHYISDGFSLIQLDDIWRIVFLNFPEIINGCEIELVSQQFDFFNKLNIDSFLN